jgi:hypothetical protein
VSRKNKQQKRVQKRKEVRKQQKAKKSSKPRLFRKEPALEEALNFRHPLVECLINRDWKEGKFASIFVLRDTPVGLVLSGFVVDLAGPGLKDAWGNYGLSYYDAGQFQQAADYCTHSRFGNEPTGSIREITATPNGPVRHLGVYPEKEKAESL